MRQLVWLPGALDAQTRAQIRQVLNDDPNIAWLAWGSAWLIVDYGGRTCEEFWFAFLSGLLNDAVFVLYDRTDDRTTGMIPPGNIQWFNQHWD